MQIAMACYIDNFFVFEAIFLNSASLRRYIKLLMKCVSFFFSQRLLTVCTGFIPQRGMPAAFARKAFMRGGVPAETAWPNVEAGKTTKISHPKINKNRPP